MSWWTYVHGTIVVSPTGRTQAEKRYVLDTVLDHLPQVTGSERDMNVYVIQKNGYNNSSSCDEFGDMTNNLTDSYGQKTRKRGWLRMQDEYILVVDGSLRDRKFEETFREFQKWLIRLAKRVSVETVLVEIEDYYKKYLITNKNDCYGEMFEYPCGTYGNKTKEPAWYEYLLWQPMDVDQMYPKILGYKYYVDEENDKQVEAWLNRGDKS